MSSKVGGTKAPDWQAWVGRANKNLSAGQIRSTPEGDVVRAKRPLGTHKKDISVLDANRSQKDVQANQKSLDDIKTSLENRFNKGLGGALFDKFFAGKHTLGRPISAKDIDLADQVGQKYDEASKALVGRFGKEAEQRIFEKTLGGAIDDERAFSAAFDKAVLAEDIHVKVSGLGLGEKAEKRILDKVLSHPIQNAQGIKEAFDKAVAVEQLRAKASLLTPHDLGRLIDENTLIAKTSDGPKRDDAIARLEVLAQQKNVNDAAEKYAALNDAMADKAALADGAAANVKQLKQEQADLGRKALNVADTLKKDELQYRGNTDRQNQLKETVAETASRLEDLNNQLVAARKGVKEFPGKGFEGKLERLEKEIPIVQGQLTTAREELGKANNLSDKLFRSITSTKESLEDIASRQKEIELELPKAEDKARKLDQDYKLAESKVDQFEQTAAYKENGREIAIRGTLDRLARGTLAPETLNLKPTLTLHQMVEDMAKNRLPPSGATNSSSPTGDLVDRLRSCMLRARDRQMESYQEQIKGFNGALDAAKKAGNRQGVSDILQQAKPWEDLRATYKPNDDGVVQMSLRMAVARASTPANGAKVGALSQGFKEGIRELRAREDQFKQGLIDRTVFTPDHERLLRACERQDTANEVLLQYMRTGRNFDDARATLATLRQSSAELDQSVEDLASNPILKLRKVLPDFLAKAIGGDMTEYDQFIVEGQQEKAKLTEMISQFELLLSFENDPDFASTVKMGAILSQAKRKQAENT